MPLGAHRRGGYLCEGSAALDGEAAQAGHGERQLREGPAGVDAQLLQRDPALQGHHLPPETASALASTAEASSQAQAERRRMHAGRTMAAGASESQRERSRVRRDWKPLTVLRVRPTHARAASLVKPVQWIPTCKATSFFQDPSRFPAMRPPTPGRSSPLKPGRPARLRSYWLKCT